MTGLATTSRGSRVWNAEQLLGRATWRYELPRAVGAELTAFVTAHPEAARDLDTFELDPRALPELAAFADGVRKGVLYGDGVAWIRGLAELDLDAAEQRLFFLAFGQAMGTAMPHYGPLYPIRDRGVDYRDAAIPVSMTNAETGFHTDSSAVDAVPDFVGLLCESPSENGGESMVSNALRVHRQLERRDPGALAELRRDMIRDVVTPGVEQTRENLLRNRFPVFAPCDRPEGVLFRYMRYWIEKGHERAGLALTAAQLAALDQLDALIRSDENVARFRLERGDIAWINNRTLAHNRSGYRDTPGHERVLQRIWLQARL